jgi:hypothetical protein
MPVPLIIGGISAAANLIGAKKSADAAKDAAKLQTAAVDKAQAFNQQAYNDQKAALQPYVEFGTNSLAGLQRQYGNGQPLINRFAPTGMTNTGQASYALPNALAPTASGMTLAAMQQQAQQQPSPAAPMGGGSVKLQAPDGEVRDVPVHLAGPLMARGARRVV